MISRRQRDARSQARRRSVGTGESGVGEAPAGDLTTAAAGIRRQRQASGRPVSYHLLWGVSLALLAFGLVMVFSASSVVGLFRENPNGFYYLRQQAVTAAGGLLALFVLSRLDYRRWRRWILGAVAAAVALLLLVKLPGVGRGANGATRWLDLGFVSLQPAEVAKLAVIGLGAHLLSLRRAQSGSTRALIWPLGPVVAGICLLILAQPDLGTALIVAFVTVGLLWVAGMRAGHWLVMTGGGLLLAVVLILTADYRRERFFAFLDPFKDAQDSGFQIIQALLALGSGGWLGVGPGRSIQKFSYLPEAHTDMIFAIIGEEFGLLGVGAVILLFALFTAAAWHLARRCADPFGKFLVTGCLFLVSGQALVNIGGVLAALPLTGVPLPFISFGRTNLFVVLAAVGIMLSVARFGPVHASLTGEAGEDSWSASTSIGDPSNVTYLDSRRRDRGTRRSRSRHS